MALLVAALVPLPARTDVESPKSKIQKNPAPQGTATPQTQTAPADKGKQPKATPAPGIQEVEGLVIRVQPERRAFVIRTATQEYEIFSSRRPSPSCFATGSRWSSRRSSRGIGSTFAASMPRKRS
jgi:hypothetical protein